VKSIGSDTISQPLLNLLAEDEMSAKKEDVVHLLAGAPHKMVDDVLPIEKLKIMAKIEIDRILTSRKVSDILGDKSKEELHRIVHLLHPDKGLVSANDSRANQALRLVFAARRATSPRIECFAYTFFQGCRVMVGTRVHAKFRRICGS